MSMDNKILVLGGNGFIGSHLVEALVADGARVRVLDRSESLHREAVLGVDYRYAELVDLAAVSEALTDIDVVVHLISTTVPATANLDPVADIEGNLIGSVRLLQTIRELGVPKLVYVSSGGTVYGNAESVPISEEHGCKPLASYGIVKLAVERYIAMYCAASPVSSLVLRVSNPYGPRQGHLGVQGVIPTFCRRMMDGDMIKIWGDGSTVRDYIYITDLIHFMVTSIRQGLTGLYNIGSGHGASLTEILEILTAISGQRPNVEYLPKRPFDVNSVVLDISKAEQALGWRPKVTLREGCERYWRWLARQSL